MTWALALHWQQSFNISIDESHLHVASYINVNPPFAVPLVINHLKVQVDDATTHSKVGVSLAEPVIGTTADTKT